MVGIANRIRRQGESGFGRWRDPQATDALFTLNHFRMHDAWLALHREAKAFVRMALKHWQSDPDLGSVRAAKELARLPQAERKSWQQFWAEVAKGTGPAKTGG